VHLAEIDSFLTSYQKYGGQPASEQFCDEYVDQTALVAEKLGVVNPPRTLSGLHSQLREYRPELVGTTLARDAAKFLLFNPPLPLSARPGYGILAGAAVSLLPGWAARELRLPRLRVLDRWVAEPLGTVATRTIRWAMQGQRRVQESTG
jgi:uncharacterized protein (DUF2236 family)